MAGMVGLGAPGLCAKYRASFGDQKRRLPGSFNGALKSYYKRPYGSPLGLGRLGCEGGVSERK